jgi:hypothetical protein
MSASNDVQGLQKRKLYAKAVPYGYHKREKHSSAFATFNLVILLLTPTKRLIK